MFPHCTFEVVFYVKILLDICKHNSQCHWHLTLSINQKPTGNQLYLSTKSSQIYVSFSCNKIMVFVIFVIFAIQYLHTKGRSYISFS